MIICGYAGIGKSYCAKQIANLVDLESTPFKKNWEVYADVIEHMHKNGYTVLTSCHKELREELKKRGLYFFVAIPAEERKDEFKERYTQRGNSEEFINLQMDNWDKWHNELREEKGYKLITLTKDCDLFDIFS